MSATPEREGRIFDVARKLPIEERAFYLDGACAGNAVLRKQVEELLEANDAVGAFLPELATAEEEFPQAGASPAPAATVRQEFSRSEQRGDTLGRYRLMEPIGEGGCGVVYMAEQQEPVRRRVALKVIKLGMDTKEVIARFEAERQALALMDHPNIAKVYDAGTTETGRPYFVMELVRGIKITEYCDQKDLSTRERLDLFVQVCHAIQHAHQKGIIHRDIKPSNILVMMADDKPVPKVIDFGIAKATAQQLLTDKTLFTAFEQFIGTPAYMSPEQAGMSGLDIDTRSDIYSLGVLLYELFTGRTPFDTKTLVAAGLEEMRRIIREQEPVRPSTRLRSLSAEELTTTARQRHADPPKLIHLLKGDLDWIVMKCLEKDRTRRYETANSLAQDLERHLQHEPVAARPPSTAYRVRKFVQRNQLMVTAASMVALALVLGIVASTCLALRERQARTEEAMQRQRAEAGKLLALAQTQLERDPTAALAYTRASLELADTPEARRFAVKVLWRGPVARILPVKRMAGEAGLPHDSNPLHGGHALSPDGRWLATVLKGNRQVLLFPWDGRLPRALPRQPDGNATRVLEFGPRSDLLVTGGSGSGMRFWSLPELGEVRTIELGGIDSWGVIRGDELLTFTQTDEREGDLRLRRVWSLPDGAPQSSGGRTLPTAPWKIDPSGTLVASSTNRTVLVSSLKPLAALEEQILGEAGAPVQDVAFAPRGDLVASLDQLGEVLIWSTAGMNTNPLHRFLGPRCRFSATRFDPTGRLVSQLAPGRGIFLWDLDSPPNTEPRSVHHGIDDGWSSIGFDPLGHWAVTDYGEGMIEFWPLKTPWARTFRDVSSTIWSMAFTDDLRWLAICPLSEPARLWPLSAAAGTARELGLEACVSLATHPTRSEVLVGTARGEVFLCPTNEGGSPRPLPGGWGGRAMATPVAFDPTGRWAVATPYSGGQGFKDPKDRVVRMWDLESLQERVYSVAQLTDTTWDGAFFLGFATDGSLYGSLGKGGEIVRLTLPAEPQGEVLSETVFTAGSVRSRLSPDGRLLLVLASETPATHDFGFKQLFLFNLVERTSCQISTHGNRLSPAAVVDPPGRLLVTGDVNGVVRVGRITGEEPHLLIGHEEPISGVAISPDRRWIASASARSVRLWPMPDVTKPPLHTLPHDELVAKLDTFTNLRAVRDETSSTGWSLEVGPFPGWETVPEW